MESIKKRIEISVVEYIEKHGIARGSRIIAAWSGGPDSTALVSILKSLDNYNFEIIAAWYNHRLRPVSELKEEKSLVERTAERLGIELIKGSAEPGEIAETARRKGMSLEDAARNHRYGYLENLAEEREADYIAVGHNLNDNTETMLMRFLQNSGASGLSGIPERRGRIIRPLCLIERSNIEQFLKEEKLEVSIDKTNLETDYLRNKLRHDILPYIRAVFPEVDSNLHSLAGKFRLQNDFINTEAEKRLEWDIKAERGRIRKEDFYSEHLLIRIRSVLAVLNRLGVRERVRYKALESSLAGKFPGNGKILLRTSSFEITSSDGHIFIQRLVNHDKKSYFIYLEPGLKASFFGQTVSACEAADNDEAASEVAADRLILPWRGRMVLRSCRDGDSIKIESGMKSLKKLFSEWKVKTDDRYRIPVVEDCGRIIAVIGRHIGYKNRLDCSGNAVSREDNKQILLIFNSDTETTCE